MNKRVLNLIALLAFLFLSSTAYSQAVTMSTATGGVAGAAQLGGTPDIAIIGVQLNKAAGGGNTVTNITVGMTPTPVGKFTNARLYESNDATFAGIGSETFVTNGTISATDISFTGAPLTNFDGATAAADDEFFFIVVDVSPSVTTGATTTPSLASTGVTASTGTVTGTTITGATYTFTALEADFTQNADDATAFSDENDVTLLDFTVNSSGTQSINSTLTFTFNTDVTNILENFDLQVGGVNIAGVETYPLTAGGTVLTVTGFSSVDVTNATTFTLLADIKAGATSANDFTVSLVPGGVTISTGLVEAFGTFNNPIDVTALEADFTQNADDATAFSDENDVTLLDFTVNSSGTQLINSTLTFTFNTDVTNILENFDLQVAGVNIGGAETYPLTVGGTVLTVTGFTSVDVTNATIFTLLADIQAGVTSANDFTVSLVPGGVTISAGTVEAFGTFSNPIDVTGLEADFTQNTDAATAFADQNNVELLDFTVNSNGTQTISPNLVFTFNTDVTAILENWDLQVAGSDIPGTELYTLNGAGTQLTISGFTGVDVTNATNFQLFADIQAGATPSNDFTISLAPGGVTIAPGTAEAFGTFSNAIDIVTSQASDIILTGGTTTPISYRGYQGANIGPGQPAAFDPAASVSLADYTIRDGGASADGDTKGMSVTSIELQVTNIQNVRTIALFNDDTDTELAGTETDVSALGPGTVTIVFTPSTPISISDGGTFNFNVRASFREAVTDNQPIQISIISAAASATGSGFSSVGSWASTQTAINQNTIAVVASKFIFSSISPSTQSINAPITITVRAVDQTGASQNIDTDYTGKVDLTRSPGGGTFTATQPFTGRNLVAGQFQWTNVQFSTSNTYTLEVSDDAYTDPPDNQSNLGDRQNDITITATNSTISQPSALNLCYGGSFQTLGNIVITETDASGFSASGTFSIALPTGFTFDTGGTPPTLSMSNSTTTFSAQSFTGGNIFQFNYSIASPTGLNALTIGNLRIRYPGSTAPSGGAQITRSGGTAVIAGVGAGTQLGTVNANLGTPPGTLGFTVAKVNPTDANIPPNETRFSQSANAVRLVGSPAGGVFSGPGVVFVSGEYRFNPQSLALSPPLYDIVYTYTEGSGQNCQFTVSKQFEVYSTNITGLNTQYCSNDPDSPILHVTRAYINGRFGASYNLKKFVYWNYDPGSGIYSQADITPLVANSGANIADDGPAQSVVFNPDNPAYSQVYVRYASPGMWVGFVVEDPIAVLTQVEWTFILVKTAPTVTITNTVTTACNDDLPITLIGSPANSNTPSDDFFSGVGVNVTPSNPRVWTFSPSSGSSSITYTYRDPSTGCSATSPAKAFTVNTRPLNVAASVIAGSIAPETCEGIPIGTFSANNPPLTAPNEYRWYSDISLINQVGTGNSFSPPSPPVNPNVAGTTKFYVTQVVDGCESNRLSTAGVPALELSVIVKATPPQPVGNFDREYCVGTTIPPADLQISVPVGVVIRWYKVGDPTVLLDDVSAPTAGQIAGALEISTASPGVYSFNVTQTANGCEGLVNPTRINVIIKALPVVDISSNAADLQKICTSGDPVTFTGSDSSVPVTSGIWDAVDGPTFPVGALSAFGGTAILNPTTVPPNTYNLRFRYTNAGNCTSADTIVLKVPPSITQIINPLDSCEGLFIRFNNLSSLNLGPFTATISKTSWNFADGGSFLPLGTGPVPYPGTNGGKTKGTFFSPEHRYSTTGSFTVLYTMETSDGCSYSGAKQIRVNNKPKIDFTWHDPCYDSVTSRSRTFFTALETSSPALPIDQYIWDFNVHSALTHLPSAGGATPMVNYTSLGVDSVELIAITTSQCRDTVQRAVYILPTYKAITDTSGYDQNFNSGQNFWTPGGIRPSWALGSTTAGTETSDGAAWATGLAGPNNDGERSWVMSGCFNFSNAQKPVVSLDTWSDTPFGVDGAVIQFNEDGMITNEGSWEVLGEVGSGINWYDGSGISSSPGNQTANDYGWTGTYSGWKKAIYKLDEVKPVTPASPDSLIVFRIAFGAGNRQQSGFAFDNVFIGERSRVVLLENFTNTNPTEAADINVTNAHNQEYEEFGDVSTGELVKIQYHTPFPGSDALNSENQQMNNSRAAFYGITEAPAARMDGGYESGLLPVWLEDYNDDRVLTPSTIRLDSTIAKKSGDNVKIAVKIQNTSSQPLPLEGINVFVVVVQKEILRNASTADLFGALNNTQFIYVAKQMLPSAAGTPLSGTLAGRQSLALDSITWSHPNGGNAIVVFLQRIDNETKPVYQAFLLENPPLPAVITGTEDPEYTKHIFLYPNPANQDLNIELPAAVTKPTPVALFDAFGRAVYQANFKAGEKTMKVPTSALANGIYMMQIITPQGSKAVKKIMVKH